LNETRSVDAALAEAFHEADRLDAPLDAKLAFYLGESRKYLPELEATYDELIARIATNHPGGQVPQIGDRLPDFCMTDSEGRLVELRELTARGPVVISFNRGPWCDYCGLELQALSRAHPAILAAGGDVVSIVPETAEHARALQIARGLPFRVLTDLDLGYAMSLGLAFWVGEKIMQAYRDFGIDLASFQAHGGWLLPIPATLVVGQDGLVKARYVDPDFRRRMRMEDILQALRE
jgi:peroxiredoxin